MKSNVIPFPIKYLPKQNKKTDSLKTKRFTDVIENFLSAYKELYISWTIEQVIKNTLLNNNIIPKKQLEAFGAINRFWKFDYNIPSEKDSVTDFILSRSLTIDEKVLMIVSETKKYFPDCNFLKYATWLIISHIYKNSKIFQTYNTIGVEKWLKKTKLELNPELSKGPILPMEPIGLPFSLEQLEALGLHPYNGTTGTPKK